MVRQFDSGLARVADVRHVRDHVLWLRFDDGLEGEVDLVSHLDRGVLRALRDPSLFARVYLDRPTIAWPGDLDWAPETLHAMVLEAKGLRPVDLDDATCPTCGKREDMAEISRFFGIVIQMYFSDHARPHFHAKHGEFDIAIDILGNLVRGEFPPSRLPLVFEWRELHRDELLMNWERLRRGEPAQPIAPLE